MFNTCLGFVSMHPVDLHAWKHCKKYFKKLSKVRVHTNAHIQCVGTPVTEKEVGMVIRI